MKNKKIKLPIFRNEIIKQGRYTNPIDELLLKINR